MQAGIALRREGRDREALDLFEQAYALAPTPRALAQVSLARQAIGDWVSAERGLAEALRSDADRWIVAYREVLERALATVRAHLGWLVVESNVPTGRLVVNGASDPEIHLAERSRVVAGAIDLDLQAEGYAPAHRAVQVAPEAEVRVAIDLDALPARAAPGASSRSEQAESPLPPPTAGTRRVAGLLAAGVAGAFAGAGLVSWGIRESNAAVYDDDARCLLGTQTRAEQCGGYAQTANIALGAEIGSFAVAGVGAGLALWWLAFPDPRPKSAVQAVCFPMARLGLGCGGQF
jgi:hypothetical protein